MGPKSPSGPVGSGGYLRPEQFLDHLTVIKKMQDQAWIHHHDVRFYFFSPTQVQFFRRNIVEAI